MRMSHINTTYTNSYPRGSSYSGSAGMWPGVNTVYPSQPGASLPGDRVPMHFPYTSFPPNQPHQQQQQYPHQPPATSFSSPASYKKPSFKLRKSILPRQPLTILYELAGGKPQFDFYDVPYEERERRAWQMGCDMEDIGCYECRCRVQGMEFIGEGVSKNQAKESVTEIAIQGLISAKCEMTEVEGEDHCPWPLIASLALHKLYNDWQSQGYELPRELTSVSGWSELPSDHHGAEAGPRPGGSFNHREVTKPPLQVLNELIAKMQLNIEMECTGEVGSASDKIFTFSVTINHKVYSGQAKSKKMAKQAAASSAIADKDAWFCPPVKHPPPPGEAEEDEEESEAAPPVKRQNLADDEEMKKLYFGDHYFGGTSVSAPKTVFREPEDKGALPGSHPQNI